MDDLVYLCDVDAIKPGDLLGVKVDLWEIEVAVYNVEGRFFVTDEWCSHGEARLSEGELEEFEIYCPFHRGAFDIRTGEATAAPCHVAIRVYDVEVTDGKVFARKRPE